MMTLLLSWYHSLLLTLQCTGVVHMMNKCRMDEWYEVCSAYILQNLPAATSTASVKVLIGPAVGYTGVHALG